MNPEGKLDTQHAEVFVIGAGPAGLAAATAAARHGRKVVVLDDNPVAGGQIWREGVSSTAGAAKPDALRNKVRDDFRKSGAALLCGYTVVDAPQPGVLRAAASVDGEITLATFQWDRLILATGARERFLPFPGWTLPGVFGAGGLQALVKGGYAVAGKRVLLAGSGPLLPAVAAYLQQAGAKIAGIIEQAPLRQLLPFAASLWKQPAKAMQGLRYRMQLARSPYMTGAWPVAVEQDDTGLTIRLTTGKRSWSEGCDLLACGFHLVANTELAALLGCRFDGDFVAVDEEQRTSKQNIFCAGEPTSIAGLGAALVQGEIAGLAAAGALPVAYRLSQKRADEYEFGDRLHRAFALRAEVRALAAAETIVCRCEDVRHEQLRRHTSWTDAKLQTRCGMGPCQGRICGPAVQELFGWRASSVRPPIFPVPMHVFQEARAYPREESDTLQETP